MACGNGIPICQNQTSYRKLQNKKMAAVSSVLLVVALAVLANIWYQKYVSTGPSFATMLKPTYDYIIVGAGSTGAVIANRLSENPDVTVLLLEAGGSSWGRPEIDVPGYVSYVYHSDADWEYYTEQQDGVLTGFKDKRSYWPRGKVAGGTSCVNSMQFVRGSRHDYDRWSEYTGDKGWSYKHVLPYFKRYENVQNPDLRASVYRGDSGPLKVYRVEPMPLAEKIIKGFKSLGYPHNTDYNGKTTAGIVNTQVNSNKGERWSTAKAFLYPAMERPNLDVSLHSHVTKVVIKNKKAVGVEVIKNGRKYTVAATKEVVLSAGAIGSPQILMLSGVGPKKHLDSLKIPVVADLPVGENLQDHLMLDMVVKIREPLSFSLASAGSLWNLLRFKVFGTGPLEVPSFLRNHAFVATTKETKEKDWPDVQIQIASVIASDPLMDAISFSDETKATLSDRNKDEYGITFLPCLCRPESRGTIQLNSSDPFDYPVIRPNYLDKQEDIETIIRGINEVKKLLDTQPMKDIGAEFTETYAVPPCDKHKYDSHEYWVCLVKHRPLTIYHPAGTCKMGSVSDSTSVVDTQLRVKGISGLRVADASIMPYVTSHNTQAPCLMIGEKAADMILGKPPLAPIDV